MYKGELYQVRNNGAILRLTPEGKKARRKDGKWTFGEPNIRGYACFCGESVHRIVATAFLGEAPSKQHVVDHIDTNRQNNRPENLRWLTRLENILLNPITKLKIEYLCGSVESFLEDPSQLYGHENEDANFTWMRAVNPEEARNTMENWKKLMSQPRQPKKNNKATISNWIFNQDARPPIIETQYPSVTKTTLSIIPEHPQENEVSEQLIVDESCKATAMNVAFISYECYFCGRQHHVYIVHSLLDAENRIICERHSHDGKFNCNQFSPKVMNSVNQWVHEHPEKNIKLGEIKPRFSRTAGEEYMSLGCPYCDGIVGNWFLEELEIGMMYSIKASDCEVIPFQ